MKNKIKAIVLTSALLCGVMLGGCANSKSVSADNDNYTFLGVAADCPLYAVYEFKDNETGVHYFSTRDGGILPRYNADGTLYCD